MLSLEPQAVTLLAAMLVAGTAFAEEEVRISIVAGQRSVTVSGKALALYDGEDGARLFAWSGGGTSKLSVDGKQVVAYAGNKEVAREKRLLVEASDAVRVNKGIFFGRVEVVVRKKRLLVINRLPLETYLLGIIGSEMNPNWPIEALKAQAVAARTYAMQRRMMMRAANRPYDLESSVLSQVYKGAEKIMPPVIRAVEETRGEVISYRHDLVQALFHSTCGGRTVSSKHAFGRDLPYLRPTRCRWCRASKRHRWTLAIPLAEMSSKLLRARLASATVTELSRKQETEQVRLEAGGRSTRVSPRKVRKAVGFGALYSARFTAETKGDTVHIHGRGFGHGVGMCQWGAKGMADAGKTYPQILGHYYRGIELRRLY